MKLKNEGMVEGWKNKEIVGGWELMRGGIKEIENIEEKFDLDEL